VPKIEQWVRFPFALRQHLIERMRDRSITLDDLNRLRLWIETSPEVPEEDWYKDFDPLKSAEQGGTLRLSSCRVNQLEDKSCSPLKYLPNTLFSRHSCRQRTSRALSTRLTH
jgi:hypothetical protein